MSIQKNSSFVDLDNAQVAFQPKFNTGEVDLIVAFLHQHLEPLCIIAHNGEEFDFRVLKAKLDSLNKTLPKGILCADSLIAFKSLPELFGEKKDPTMDKIQHDKKFVSYGLGSVYKRVFKTAIPHAHSSEGDCLALLQLFHQKNMEIVSLIDQTAKLF